MKKILLIASIMGAFFVAPEFHMYKMQVATVKGENAGLLFRPCISTADFDADKVYMYGIYADDIEVGDNLLTFCVGGGEEMKVLDYRKLER